MIVYVIHVVSLNGKRKTSYENLFFYFCKWIYPILLLKVIQTLFVNMRMNNQKYFLLLSQKLKWNLFIVTYFIFIANVIFIINLLFIDVLFFSLTENVVFLFLVSLSKKKVSQFVNNIPINNIIIWYMWSSWCYKYGGLN